MATFSGSLDAAGGGHPSTLLSRSPTKVTSPHLQKALKTIYGSLLTKGASTLTIAQFQSFLKDTQKTNLGEDFSVWTKLVFAHSPKSAMLKLVGGGGEEAGVTFEDFLAYMTSPHSSALAIPDQKKKDLSKPLNEYFISSSHNTYLVGHQLYGSSTTQGYINVLRRGCRCIEIDVWDGDDGEPEVFHGWTLTKEISFKEVCEAIRDHAFWADGIDGGEVVDGPVIISLECHASHKQQEKMVQIMKKVWGDMLVSKPLYGESSLHNVEKMPSVADLRRKILVKTKYLPPDPAPPTAVSATAPRMAPKILDPSDTDSSSDSSDSELEEAARLSHKTKPKKVKVTRSLANLAIYCAARTFTSFLDPTARHPTHVFSFSEKVFQSHHKTDPTAIFNHNLHHLMRVYPFGLRFSSSNADPTFFWRRGVQLVALNWQKCDEGMMLNEGLFAGEGGYVLKPPQYRPSAGVTAETNNKSVGDFKKLNLEIEVIAAQGIPLPDDDDKPSGLEPYVKVEVHVESGEDEVKARTKKASNKGIDASWEPRSNRFSSSSSSPSEYKRIGEIIKFTNINGVVGDGMLSFVRFKIHDEEFGRDDLAAWACIRLDRLQQGYRFVDLFDVRGRRSGGVLLVRVGWGVA